METLKRKRTQNTKLLANPVLVQPHGQTFSESPDTEETLGEELEKTPGSGSVYKGIASVNNLT